MLLALNMQGETDEILNFTENVQGSVQQEWCPKIIS